MTPEQLQPFCARIFDGREHLYKPWAHQGYVYATNGHIMVRIPSPADAATVSQHEPATRAAKMFEDAGKGKYTTIPRFDAAPTCLLCEGRGKYLQIVCPDCNGEGSFLHGEYTYLCQRCNEDGRTQAEAGDKSAVMRDCPGCGGYGAHRGQFERIGNASFDAVYLAMLKTLPGVRLCVNGSAAAAHFTFDGGEGLLMPMREA